MAVQLPKTIRQWFTPEQACKYLSQAFECEVTESDLNQNLSDLPIYIKVPENIVTTIPVFERLCEIEPIYRNLLNKYGHGLTVIKITGDIFKVLSKEWDYDFEIWLYKVDLQYKQITFGDTIDSTVLNMNINELDIQFVLFSDEKEMHDVKNDYLHGKILGEIGYPRHELERFIKAQTETPETQEPKELSTRERGTYQNIIKSLLHELKEKGVSETAFASIITTNSELLGAPVPQSTAYKKLNELKK